MVSRSQLTLAAVVASLGFLLVTAAVSARDTRRATEPRKSELISLIESRRQLVARLDDQVTELQQEAEQARRRASRRSSADRAQSERASTAALHAGTAAVRGPGVVVRLGDSKRQPSSPEEAGAYRIHDRDLQLVVNALFAAGAEAVAVDDNRVVSTSPIRAAGETILVNFRPLAPPYDVVAVGARPGDFERSDVAKRFRRWEKLFGLVFDVDTERSITVPGYTGRVAITAARPVNEDGGG